MQSSSSASPSKYGIVPKTCYHPQILTTLQSCSVSVCVCGFFPEMVNQLFHPGCSSVHNSILLWLKAQLPSKNTTAPPLTDVAVCKPHNKCRISWNSLLKGCFPAENLSSHVPKEIYGWWQSPWETEQTSAVWSDHRRPNQWDRKAVNTEELFLKGLLTFVSMVLTYVAHVCSEDRNAPPTPYIWKMDSFKVFICTVEGEEEERWW